MEAAVCPPFCEPECSTQHDKLLLALVNCPDDDITEEYQETLRKLISEKQKQRQCRWELSSPIDDPNPDFRYPVVLWACALGKPKLVEWLLQNGFQSNTQDIETGDNGLHRSIMCLQICGDVKRAASKFWDLLSPMENCIMEQNAMGCTPLHTICDMYASEHPVPEFFLKCGTAMMEYAASKGQDFANGLVNCQTVTGDTVLHILASEDSTAKLLRTIVKLTKPNLRLRDSQGMTALGVAISSGHMKTCQFLSKHLNTGFDDEIENQSNEVENQSNLEIIQSHLQELDEHFINMEDNQSLVTDKQVDGTRKSPRKSEITITYIKNSPKSPKERGLSSPKTRKLAVNAKLSRLSVRNRKLSGNTELSPSSARTRKLSGNTELSPSSARQRKISGNAELFPGKADSTSVQAERSPKSPKESGITSPSRRKSTKDAEISNVDKNSDTIKSPRKGIKRKFEDYKAGEEGMSENEKAGDDSDDEGFTNVFEFSKNLNKMFQIKYFNKKFKTDRDTNNNNDKVKQNTTDKKRSPVDNKSERKVVSEESSTEIVMPVTCCRQSYSLEKMEMLSMNEKSIENVEKIRRLTRRNPYSSNLRQSWSVYKSKRQSVTRRHSVGSISMKQKVDSESCPRLSPHVSDQITKLKEGMEECPPMLSSEASLNILEEAKSLAEKEQKLKATEVIKNNPVWSRYIKDWLTMLPDSLPMIMKMRAPQIDDILSVNPSMREKLSEYLEALDLEELSEIPETTRDVILNDPAEEILKDMIARDLKENQEREERLTDNSDLDFELDQVHADKAVTVASDKETVLNPSTDNAVNTEMKMDDNQTPNMDNVSDNSDNLGSDNQSPKMDNVSDESNNLGSDTCINNDNAVNTEMNMGNNQSTNMDNVSDNSNNIGSDTCINKDNAVNTEMNMDDNQTPNMYNVSDNSYNLGCVNQSPNMDNVSDNSINLGSDICINKDNAVNTEMNMGNNQSPNMDNVFDESNNLGSDICINKDNAVNTEMNMGDNQSTNMDNVSDNSHLGSDDQSHNMDNVSDNSHLGSDDQSHNMDNVSDNSNYLGINICINKTLKENAECDHAMDIDEEDATLISLKDTANNDYQNLVEITDAKNDTLNDSSNNDDEHFKENSDGGINATDADLEDFTLICSWSPMDSEEEDLVTETAVKEKPEMISELTELNEVLNVETGVDKESGAVIDEIGIVSEKTAVSEENDAVIDLIGVVSEMTGVTEESDAVIDEIDVVSEKTSITGENYAVVDKIGVVSEINGVTEENDAVVDEIGVVSGKTGVIAVIDEINVVGEITGVTKKSDAVIDEIVVSEKTGVTGENDAVIDEIGASEITGVTEENDAAISEIGVVSEKIGVMKETDAVFDEDDTGLSEKADATKEGRTGIGNTCKLVDEAGVVNKEIDAVSETIGEVTSDKTEVFKEIGVDVEKDSVVVIEEAGVNKETGVVIDEVGVIVSEKTDATKEAVAVNENTRVVVSDKTSERKEANYVNEKTVEVISEINGAHKESSADNENTGEVVSEETGANKEIDIVCENGEAVSKETGAINDSVGSSSELDNVAATTAMANAIGNDHLPVVYVPEKNDRSEEIVSQSCTTADLDADESVPLNVSPVVPNISINQENAYTTSSPLASPSQSTSISCRRRDSSVDETDTESGTSEWQDSSCSDSEMVSSTSTKKKSRNKSLDLDSSGLKEYLNLSSSTKDALRQKLIGDRREYEELIQKKCELLAEIATKGYDLEKTTEDIDAKIDETETRLKRLKQKRVDTRRQTEVVHAREKEVTANVQDIRSKLQVVDKALIELNSE